MLSGSETWSLTDTVEKEVERFELTVLRVIMNPKLDKELEI